MKIVKPQIGYLEKATNLLQEIDFAYNENIDIKDKEFNELEIEQNLELEKVEFSSCKFSNCKIVSANMNYVCFTDIIFENCDFSNTSFEKANYVR